MTLELNKLTGQVDAMGRALATRRNELAVAAADARSLLAANPEVSDELRRKIDRARELDAWRRGATPLGDRLDERRLPSSAPDRLTLLAADGSQIYPDRHAIATYYLLNTGAMVFRVGSGEAPQTSSLPELFYEEADLYDAEGRVHSTESINAQRNRREIAALADLAEAEREALGGDLATPIIALIDGPLLPWMAPGTDEADLLDREIGFFVGQMARLRAAGVIPIGYVDRPGSAYVLRILELIELPLEQISREALRQGRFRRLTDRMVFDNLAPSERSGLFTPNSGANDRYSVLAGGDRIAFAYMNMARRPGRDAAVLARIEMPGWVAGDPARLDMVQAALHANCEPAGYPYVLARTHELAVVGPAEREALEQMLGQAMLRNGFLPEVSAKAANKLLTGRTIRR